MRITSIFLASLFFSLGLMIIVGVTPLPPSIQGRFWFLIPLGLFILGFFCFALGYKFGSENKEGGVG